MQKLVQNGLYVHTYIIIVKGVWYVHSWVGRSCYFAIFKKKK